MKSIIFSGEMVRAILEGRKTQTRRIVKIPKEEPLTNVRWGCSIFTPENCISLRGTHANGEWGESFVRNPYGKRGDRLWVREAFRVETDGDEQFITFVADGKTLHDPKISEKWTHMQAVVYGDTVNGPYARPSIHMPRFVSRITLEITNVRVERLQDITGKDAWAEGVIEKFDSRYSDVTTIRRFRTLWDKINGKKHPWSENPWVWVIEFKQI